MAPPLPDDTFTVRNVGYETLTYVITDDMDWLSVSPDQGTSTGEADLITVTYDTTGLLADTYVGLMTITDPAAANSPRPITVRLTLTTVAPDFDRDGDGRSEVLLETPDVYLILEIPGENDLRRVATPAGSARDVSETLPH